jgi:dolichyl-phosphate-mannose-protein mannosyltransferase
VRVRERFLRLLGEAMLVLGVLVAGLWVLGEAAGRVPFHNDEGFDISTAPYFEYLFLRRDVTRGEWRDNYVTHTQPMIGRYIIGGWLWSHGYNLQRLPRPPRWSLSPEENRRQGRIPNDALLAAARAPMVISAAGAVTLLYALGRVLAGAPAGLAAAALALGSPLAQEHLVRARPDSPLALFLLLALLLGLLGARPGHLGGLPIGWALAMGVALGLALGTKLTAALSLAAVLGWGMVVALLAATGDRGADGLAPWARLARAWTAARGWALAPAVAFGVFVLSNPHLYPDPLAHTFHLFASRREEGEIAQRYYPSTAVHDPLEAASYVLGRSLGSGTFTGSRGLPLEAALAAVGAAALLLGAWRDWRRTGRAPAAGLALSTAAVYFVATSALLQVAWDRYLVPTLLIGTLLSGLGVSAAVSQLSAIGGAFKTREPAGKETPLKAPSPFGRT